MDEVLDTLSFVYWFIQWPQGKFYICLFGSNMVEALNGVASRFLYSVVACVMTISIKGHFAHEPRAMTMKLWEPKRKWPKAVPIHLPTHVVWSRTFKCSAKSYVTRSSTETISMNVYSHGSSHMIIQNKPTVVNVRSAMVSLFCVRTTSKRRFLKIVPMTMKHDPFDAT